MICSTKTFLFSTSSKPLTTSQLDEIFNDDMNMQQETTQTTISNNVELRTRRSNTTESDSGIGGAGTLIFDSYDEDILFRDAYHSPQQSAEIFPKRPSLELNLQGTDEKVKETNARNSVPNTPHNESFEDDNDKDELPASNSEYIAQSQQSMESVSSRKTADTGLLHKNHFHDDELEVKHSGFIAIGGGNTTAMMTTTDSTPISDADASILIEKTSSCSCFGWFSKKKRNKNIGLAQQELR